MAAHLLAGLATFSLPRIAGAVVLVGVLISAYASIAPLTLSRIRGLDALVLGPDGSIQGCDPNGDTIPLELRNFRILSPGCIVVSIRSIAKRQSIPLLLLAGDQGENALRQLRLWLRWQSDKGRVS